MWFALPPSAFEPSTFGPNSSSTPVRWASEPVDSFLSRRMEAVFVAEFSLACLLGYRPGFKLPRETGQQTAGSRTSQHDCKRTSKGRVQTRVNRITE